MLTHHFISPSNPVNPDIKLENTYKALKSLLEVPANNFPSIINRENHDKVATEAFKLYDEVTHANTYTDFKTVDTLYHKCDDLDNITKKDLDSAQALRSQFLVFSTPIKSKLSSYGFKTIEPEIKKINDLLDLATSRENVEAFLDLYVGLKNKIKSSELFSKGDKEDLIKRLDHAYLYFNASYDYTRAPPEDKKTIAQNQFIHLWKNCSTQYAIRYATKHGLINDTAKDVGEFLFTNLQNKALTYDRVGDFLFKAGSAQYLNAFLGSLHYAGRNIEEGVRLTFETLPKATEGQVLDRCLNEFSKVYASQNGINDVNRANAIYYLAFELLTLHTELHNPNAKKNKRKNFETWYRFLTQQWNLLQDVVPLNDLASKDQIHNFYRQLRDHPIIDPSLRK